MQMPWVDASHYTVCSRSFALAYTQRHTRTHTECINLIYAIRHCDWVEPDLSLIPLNLPQIMPLERRRCYMSVIKMVEIFYSSCHAMPYHTVMCVWIVILFSAFRKVIYKFPFCCCRMEDTTFKCILHMCRTLRTFTGWMPYFRGILNGVRKNNAFVCVCVCLFDKRRRVCRHRYAHKLSNFIAIAIRYANIRHKNILTTHFC